MKYIETITLLKNYRNKEGEALWVKFSLVNVKRQKMWCGGEALATCCWSFCSLWT